LVDVRLRWLDDAPQPLKHYAELEFYSGAFQTLARARLLGDKELAPGQTGWVQFVLDDPAALAKHDRLIVRQPSPSMTVGGGSIVDAHPARRVRRFRPEVIQRLERLAHGTPDEVLLEVLTRAEPMSADDLLKQSNLPREAAAAALKALLESGQAVQLDERALYSGAGWRALLEKIRERLGDYHRQYPLRAGMAREELKSRLGLNARLFDLVVARAARANLITDAPTSLRLISHKVVFTPAQEAQIKQLVAAFSRSQFAPPSIGECEALVGAEVLGALIEQGRLVKVNEGVIFSAEAYQEMVERVRAHLTQNGSITVAQVRDMFNASRKYALGLMEHLDEVRLTRRVGDERVLR
ncbi:MAG: SelB C-terminal domain-containing protein, partial [Chloroflexi bacterium]|nr:SelB C-terminal domain-containing protein [Chloroflexota bacterium]